MSEKFCPSNGTEGMIFMDRFCDKCIYESMDDPCEILTKTMAYNVTDPEYPEEWISDESGERCTKFATEKPVPVDPDQTQLFEDRGI